jgi:hypothetical protein
MSDCFTLVLGFRHFVGKKKIAFLDLSDTKWAVWMCQIINCTCCQSDCGHEKWPDC